MRCTERVEVLTDFLQDYPLLGRHDLQDVPIAQRRKELQKLGF